MRVLVCGGRDYADQETARRVLDEIHTEHCITWIIPGAARGADNMGPRWSFFNKVASEEYPADWTAHGKAAGPIRNAKMIADGRPDLVIAFPGGRGTADMVRRAKVAGIRVVEWMAPP